MEPIALASLIGLTFLVHAAFYIRTQHAAKEATKRAEESLKKRPLDVSAAELLGDLVANGAIVRIERIDPESMLLWRTR